MKKLSKELPNWEKEIGKEETIKIIKNMVNFMGSVPKIPNELLGIKGKDDIVYMCSRDKMSRLLNELSIEYKNEQLKEAGKLFYKSGKDFEKLCSIFVDYISGESDYKDAASKIILSIADFEYNAFILILSRIKTI